MATRGLSPLMTRFLKTIILVQIMVERLNLTVDQMNVDIGCPLQLM